MKRRSAARGRGCAAFGKRSLFIQCNSVFVYELHTTTLHILRTKFLCQITHAQQSLFVYFELPSYLHTSPSLYIDACLPIAGHTLGASANSAI